MMTELEVAPRSDPPSELSMVRVGVAGRSPTSVFTNSSISRRAIETAGTFGY